MTIDATALPVTIVSTDRVLLRETSWTLQLFGYQVTTSCDWSEESPWRRADRTELLLLDARQAEETASVLKNPRVGAYNYRLVVDPTTSDQSAEKWLAAGADDVLRLPINTGELLTRLRAGVRRLEFERRAVEWEGRHASQGFFGRQGLLGRLDSLRRSGGAMPESLVLCGIDLVSLVRRQHGERALNHLIAALARCLAGQLKPGELCSDLGDGVFAALLYRPPNEAKAFAEATAAEFGGRETLAREIRSRPSLSATVVEWNTSANAAEFLGSIEAMFSHLQSYGGNCVVEASDVQQEIAAWRRGMDAGTPFQTVVAQDMMESFPLILTQAEFDPQALQSQAADGQCLPPCIAVVDDAGKLAGTVLAERLSADAPAELVTSPDTVQHNQPLSDLFEAFSEADESCLVVVDDDRHPLGYVTCEGLASLIVDPMDAGNYQPRTQSRTGLASLVVPVEPVPADEAALAT